MSELKIFRCERCGTAWFPERLRCPRCGGVAFARIPAGAGRVEETTTLRRAPGSDGTILGSVRLDARPVVIARLDAGVTSGARVRLHALSDNVIWARPA